MAEAPLLGRGRGRGVLISGDLESVATSSSTSERRTVDSESTESNNGNGKSSRGPLKLRNTKPEQINDKTGTSGTKVTLSANYFQVIKKPSFAFSLYRVDFEPEVGNEKIRKSFVNQQSDYFGGHLYDGGNIIYLTHRLPDAVKEFAVEDRFTQAPYKVKIKFTGQVIEDTDAMAFMIYNTMLRRSMEGLQMELVGRNLYDARSKVKLDQFRIELWPGFITSIRQHEQNILTCVEVSHKVMRQETIYEILRNCRQEDERNFKDLFRKEIIGTIVLTAYNNKTYRVDDVDFNSNPKLTFKQKDRDVSYVDYYQAKYNLAIRDTNQPMLVSNPKPADIRAGRTTVVFLVPELCRATGLTDKQRANFQMMKAMAEHTQMDPERRRTRLLTLTERLYNTPQSVLQLSRFDMELDRNIIKFNGRALNQENIIFGCGKTATNDDRVDWTNASKSNEMFSNIPLKRWVLIYPKRCAREVEDFLRLMKEVSDGMHYDIADPKLTEMPDDRVATYVAHLNNIIAKDPKMIMVVVPNNAADRYSAIKKITCIEKTIPTQVIVQKTMMPKKGSMAGVKSIATKVMIQINCKLGGAPWMINFPLKGTMTIGFDVTHDTRDKSKSFGAFVATMDLKQKIAFFSAASPHKDGNELSSNIDLHIVSAMKQFKNTHGSLPERVMFYRDGVGDGQIEQVHTQEVKRIQEKMAALYTRFGDGKQPKFTFIIVNKRLNTRIFLNKGVRVSNPASGTVVDTTITLPERYDFYLVSQSVRQGTVAPTSYNIIHDTSGLKPDQMQVITYKNTHLYYNWMGTTRVPAVVQYAHKLALLVGQSLHQAPSNAWDGQLYFL